MRVPVYEEVIIKNTDVMSVVDVLRKSKVGRGPTYLNLAETLESKTVNILNTLVEALKILKISPYFPYPLYVISPIRPQNIDMPFLDTVEQLPNHFFSKIKKLNSKELDLNHKISTLTERIANQPIETRRKELKDSMKIQKKLYHLTKEQAFYERLIVNLKKRECEQ
jgi:hypothetical protein